MSDESQNAIEVAPALSRDAAQAMRSRFRARLRKTVDKALGDKADETPAERKSLLFNFAYRLAHARNKVTADAIESVLRYSDDELKTRTANLKKAFPMNEATSLVREAEGKHGQRHGHMFADGEWRRYYAMPTPRQEDLGRVAEDTIRWLTEQGFTDIDYIAGTCVDDRKQTRRIGRVLPDDYFKQRFANDTNRQGGNLMMVISRHPYDVIRMSTGRAWESCMTRGGMYWEYVPKEVKEGSMVAYLVSKNDPEILDPMSRVAIKPLRNKKGETIMKCGPAYGLGSDLFEKAVQTVLDREYNTGLYGEFKMPDTVYGDGVSSTARQTPADIKEWDAEKWIAYLGLETTQFGDRTIIKGDLNLDEYGLEKLPDFSGYWLQGTLNIQGNPLTDLTGCPADVGGDLYANNCALTSLQGAPERVGNHVYIGGNKLTSLEHCPQMTAAASLSAGNNELASLKGCPERLGKLDVSGNNLTDLVGAPRMVESVLSLEENQLETLEGMPLMTGEQGRTRVSASKNKLTSLKGLDGKLNKASLEISMNPDLKTLEGCPKVLHGSLYISGTGLTSFEGGPERVNGDIVARRSQFTSLKGAPAVIGGRLVASHNPLQSIAGLPAKVERGIDLRDCGLTSLKGMPPELSCSLDISNNRLTSFEGMSTRIEGDLVASRNPLKTLEGMAKAVTRTVRLDNCDLASTKGITQHVGGHLILDSNLIKELEDMPQRVGGHVMVRYNKLTSTRGLPKHIEGYADLTDNPMIDATDVPTHCEDGIMLGHPRNLRHLPATLPKGVPYIIANGIRHRASGLPDRDYPPRDDSPPKPLTETPAGDTFSRSSDPWGWSR
ncbi:MAG: hypothetical protein Alpg2KO_16810 [Alphaproteobacteria bacterium]